MGDVIIKGPLAAIDEPIEVTFDPRNGIQTNYKQRAAGGPTPLIQRFLEAVQTNCRARLVISPVTSELEVTSPEVLAGEQEIITDTWQVVGNELNKSVYENPLVVALISANDLAVIARAVENKISLTEAVSGLNADYNVTTYTVPTNTVALQLFGELGREQDSYAVAQYVLRHTTNCSVNSGVNVSDFNVEAVYTTSQLLSEVENGNLWFQTLPNRLRSKILSIQAPPFRTGYLWGWRKLASTETVTPNNRVEINTEYWLEQWSLLRYATAT